MAKTTRETKEAIGYLRTSSSTNVGTDKDSEKPQREAIQSFAERAGITIVDWFYDPAVSGGDAIDSRPGFAAALERIASNDVRTIIVETANRFARDVIVRETGFRLLRQQGIELIASDSPGSFVDDTPAVALIRQVLGAVVQFEKVALVAKLKGARDRKRRATGKCEGRRSHADTRPDMVALAKRLRRANPKTGERLSYQRISAQLAEAGFFNENGRPFNSKSVMAMVTHRVEKAATPATAD